MFAAVKSAASPPANTRQPKRKAGRSSIRTRSVVIITHNSALTAMADRVIQVKSGTIHSISTNEHPTPVEEIEW